MSTRKVLIVGATGGVGGSLLKQLLALPVPYRPAIRVSTRNPTKASFPSDVDVVQGDLLDPSSYTRLFRGVERAFLYAKPSAPLAQLCSTAKEEGVKHIVLLSSFTVQMYPDSPIGRFHKKMENAIVDSGIPYTFIRAGGFSSNILWQWLPTMAQTGKVYLTYPNAQMATVAEDDMAAVAVAGLTTDKLLNRAELVTGPDSITQQERVATINRLREREGKKPVEIVALSPKDAKVAGILDGFSDLVLRDYDRKAMTIYSSDRFSDKPSQSFGDWLEINKEAFLGF